VETKFSVEKTLTKHPPSVVPRGKKKAKKAKKTKKANKTSKTKKVKKTG